MIQRAHLLAISIDNQRVLTEWHGGSWLLPFCTIEPRDRAARAAAHAAQRLGLTGFIADLSHSRVSSDLQTTDLLAVWACTDSVNACIPSTTRWVPADRLEERPAFLDVQAALLSLYRDKHDTSSDQLMPRAAAERAHIKEWVAKALRRDSSHEVRIVDFEQYRASRRRTVIKFDTSAATPVFFRATSKPSFTEAKLSAVLSALHSKPSAPKTLGMDDRRGWWLCASATGIVFDETAGFAAHESVTRQLARLQMTLMPHASALQQLGVPLVSWRTVHKVLDELLADFEQRANAARDALPSRGIPQCREGIRRVCSELEGCDNPLTWIDTDLFYGNVFRHADRIELVDVEKSLIAAPHLALETFLTNLARLRPEVMDWQPALRASYYGEWGGTLSGDVRRRMEETGPIAARLLRMALRAELTAEKIEQRELLADMTTLRDRAARQLCDIVMRPAETINASPAVRAGF